MAINKNALIRYQVLDRCFRNPGRNYFWEDLLREVNEALINYNGLDSGIRRRQLYDDITFMESEEGWSVPLERHRDGKRTYYRYDDLTFSINNQPLNEQEINELQSALHLLGRFDGIPQLEALQVIIPRLGAGKPADAIAPIVGFDQNPYLQGKDLFRQLFSAIHYRQVLRVAYQDFKSGSPYELTFHPAYLKQYNNRWFALGLVAEWPYPTANLALDRIRSAETAADIPYSVPEVDWQEYFDDLIGVTRYENASLTRIKLWCAPDTAPYILTKPLHGSQRTISQDEAGLTLSIEVYPNPELYSLLLSFGERIRVLSPEEVQAELAQKLRAALKGYP